MAETKVTKNEMNYPIISTDANGWTVHDFGTFKQYSKKGTLASQSWNASQWKWIVLSSNIPVGITNLSECFVTSSATVADAAVSICIQPVGTDVQCSTANNYTGAVSNVSIYWSITATKAV